MPTKRAAGHYTIGNVNLSERTVFVRASYPVEALRGSRIGNFLFPNPPIRVENLRPCPNGSCYTVGFRDIAPEKTVPPLYPTWHGDTFAIPLWCLLLVPADRREPEVRVSLEGRGGPHRTNNIKLISPPAPGPLSQVSGFCLFGGFQTAAFTLAGARFTLHFAHRQDRSYLLERFKAAATAHHRFFGEWLWSKHHMLIESQMPPLPKQKAMLFSAGELAFGRYQFRSIQPDDPFEKTTQIDIIEHEMLHYYIDTEAPAGSWLVEGLTTYLSRKLLFEAGLLTEHDWLALVTDAFQECGRNPLCPTTSLNAAPARFWDARYGNVIYSKGFLVACLLDQELIGGLLALARDLFRHKVRRGRPFGEADFFRRLPDQARRKLETWLRRKDLRDEFLQIRALARP